MAYKFNGTNEHLEIIPSQGLPTALPLTISAWYKTPTSSWTVGEAIAGLMDTDGQPRFYIGTSNAGVILAVATTAAGSNSNSTAGTITTDRWTHITGVFQSTTLRTVYVDGVAGTPNTVTNSAAPSTTIQIGRRILSEQRAKGNIAEVAMWNVGLNVDEIGSLAKGISAISIRPQNLFFYTPLVREKIELRYGTSITTAGAPSVSEHPRIYR